MNSISTQSHQSSLWFVHIFLCRPIADQEHNKNQEDEEEAAEEDREERHAGSDAEGAEAECKRQRAEKQQG